MPSGAPRESWLDRLGLNRPELRAWAMYDWANSAFWTTVIAVVFPQYFARVLAADLPAGQATATSRGPRRWPWPSWPPSLRCWAPSPTTPR